MNLRIVGMKGNSVGSCSLGTEIDPCLDVGYPIFEGFLKKVSDIVSPYGEIIDKALELLHARQHLHLTGKSQRKRTNAS